MQIRGALANGLLKKMRAIAAGKPLSDDTVALSVAAQVMASESNAGPLVVLYTARGDEVNKDARGQASLFWSNGEVERLYSGLPLQRRLQLPTQISLLSRSAPHWFHWFQGFDVWLPTKAWHRFCDGP